jgi:hypothetical protein
MRPCHPRHVLAPEAGINVGGSWQGPQSLGSCGRSQIRKCAPAGKNAPQTLSSQHIPAPSLCSPSFSTAKARQPQHQWKFILQTPRESANVFPLSYYYPLVTLRFEVRNECSVGSYPAKSYDWPRLRRQMWPQRDLPLSLAASISVCLLIAEVQRSHDVRRIDENEHE